MTSSERKLLLIFGMGCLLIIGIILISLWHYRELIGFLIVGLATLSLVVTLGLKVIQTLADTIVKLHEQKLRQERLRPNNNGYYEIPLNDTKVAINPPSHTLHLEEEEFYSQGYNPLQFNREKWPDQSIPL